jgi:hypothetical protein
LDVQFGYPRNNVQKEARKMTTKIKEEVGTGHKVILFLVSLVCDFLKSREWKHLF